jgi:TonB family protein
MTIVSTASSGGGLRDFGIFRNEVVSTVYIEMTHSPTPAPSWTLQYSLLQKGSGMSPERVVGPFPIEKEKPQFPLEVVARNLGRLIVVYAEINVEGRVVNTRIIQSPNPLLNSPLLEALAKWAFRPAESEGKPVAVKTLLGIPLSLPPS